MESQVLRKKQSMIFAHRGNLDGPSDHENTMPLFRKATSLGYGIEIDIWKSDGKIWVGHDSPFYPIERPTIQALSDRGPIILDCKNYGAMVWASQNFCGPRIDAYYYLSDHPTFSMFGRLVFRSGDYEPPNNCSLIQVMPEHDNVNNWNCITNNISHIVTDYPGEYT